MQLLFIEMVLLWWEVWAHIEVFLLSEHCSRWCWNGCSGTDIETQDYCFYVHGTRVTPTLTLPHAECFPLYELTSLDRRLHNLPNIKTPEEFSWCFRIDDTFRGVMSWFWPPNDSTESPALFRIPRERERLKETGRQRERERGMGEREGVCFAHFSAFAAKQHVL